MKSHKNSISWFFFLQLYEFELESYFHMYKLFQLIKGTNHFHKFTVATRG